MASLVWCPRCCDDVDPSTECEGGLAHYSTAEDGPWTPPGICDLCHERTPCRCFVSSDGGPWCD